MARKKIGFVLISNRNHPLSSTRIAVLNMLPYLRQAGYEPHILFEPAQATEQPEISGVVDRADQLGIDIVYFQKVCGPSVTKAARSLSARGIKSIYGVCDFIDNQMAEATDATIVVTDYLKNLYDARLQHKIFVVHDGIENPDFQVRSYRTDSGSRSNPLRAVLVTAQQLYCLPGIEWIPAFLEVRVIGRYRNETLLSAIKGNYWQFQSLRNAGEITRFLRSLINRRFKKIAWNIKSIHQNMSECDIGIIPVDMQFDPLPGVDVSSWQVRSENRLTMKMAMGLPVIASPVPSYKEVIVQGENGFLATTREQWLECFETLRDPRKRMAIGQRARETVIQRYSQEEQAKKLLAVLERVKRGR